MDRCSARWIWLGRGVFVLVVAAFTSYLVVVGLDKADKIASSIGAVLALLALGGPYLLAVGKGAAAVRLSRTGRSIAGPAGQAVSGLRAPADALGGKTVVDRTGDADASGGGHATSGIELT